MARNVGDVGNVAVTLLLADLFRHAIRVPTVRKNPGKGLFFHRVGRKRK